MTATETTKPADNGVNVEALLGARDAMTEMPAAAAFTWRATSEWVNGTHTKATVSDFFGIGEEQDRSKTFRFDIDHPEQFAAANEGASPVEFILVGLAGCLTAGVASVAQNRGVQLRSVTARVEGDMDLRGILGIDKSVRNGYQQIRVCFDVDADATPAEIASIVAQSQKRSAVYDIVSNPTAVSVEVSS